MTLIEIFTILIIHWIADFWLQTDSQAKGKSNNWKDLLSHTLTYSSVWLIIGTLIFILTAPPIESTLNYFTMEKVFLFSLITLAAHTITDYFTSRLNAYWWKKEKRWEFFVSIGGDQILHYIQLFLTYQLLK